MKLLFTLILITAALSSLNCNMYGPPPGLPDAVKVDEIPDFMKADEIQIEDDWTGLSPVAPIKRHYALQRSENNFTGTADLSVGGARRQARSASENIVIPMNMALSFLEKLEQADFREGDYEPNLKWTDDYPSIKIELRIKGDNVVIFSKSQGNDHTPWGMSYKGKIYLSDSPAIKRALNELIPFLKPEVFKQLIKSD